VLRSLVYDPTGAIVAAPTTSLPESPEGTRTWDYRYAWIRDAVLATRCLTELGHDEEAAGFRRFIERSAAGSADDLLVCYGVGGERRIGEQMLDGLDGFQGIGPVRIGNDAASQLQLDAYGHLLEQSWRWCQLGHSPDDDYWRFLLDLADAAAERWREPDRGIWEWRGEPRHFVHSKMMCWVALDRASGLADGRRSERWRREAAAIRAFITDECWSDRLGAYRRAAGVDELDASILIGVLAGYPNDDGRLSATVTAIREGLADGPFVRRYLGEDGLPGSEGAFLACSFWLVEALVRTRQRAAGADLMDQLVGLANDVGLFAEEIDPRTGGFLGNFPQALTHLALIGAATAFEDVG
jgi:GH15 family glucan-1,4-alpha-glucosidase